MSTLPCDRFLRYAELTECLHSLVRDHPRLVSIESIGKSHEGRDIWVLTVTNAASGPAHDDHWYDVQTKFDLAKAYQEMGDKEGAREILTEVIKEGDAQQQAEAKALMDGDVRKYGSKTVVAIFDEYYRYFQPFEGLDFLKAMADRNRFIRAWTTFMADYPLVLTPFLPAPIFTWNRDEQGAEGVREVLGSALYSYAMNFMGLPAAFVPANENDAQPVGVQIVGRRFREDMILDAAEAVERSVGVMAERLWRR